jgi:isocitrate dehydrogenase
VRVLDAAVEKAYGGKRKIHWLEVLAGEKAFKQTNNWLPDETSTAFREYLVGIKGPLTTPDRRRHPLAERRAAPDARPVRLPAPGALVQGRALAGEAPEKVDMVIFRENTEDIYAGIEFEAGHRPRTARSSSS